MSVPVLFNALKMTASQENWFFTRNDHIQNAILLNKVTKQRRPVPTLASNLVVHCLIIFSG